MLVTYTATTRERLERRLVPEPNTGCLLWSGSANPSGHGTIFYKGRPALVHRLAWEFERGDPGALCVLHRCDTPACANIDHLFLGTRADNNADMTKKGRRAAMPRVRRGEENARAKLSSAQVHKIRQMLASRVSQRTIARTFGVRQCTISAINVGRLRNGKN